MKWFVYMIVVLGMLSALCSCDEQSLPAESNEAVSCSDTTQTDLAAAAEAAGMMLDVMGYPKVDIPSMDLDLDD
jgi:hypothetical protein